MVAKTKSIKIASEFSDEPFGRYPVDGDDNGERFRNEYLIPGLESHDIVLVDFDGAEGYGSSFLEESFGGLVRKCGYAAADLLKRIKFKSEEDESLIEEVTGYITSAIPER